MGLRWYSVVIDSRDHRELAAWWARVLDWVAVYESDDEMVLMPRFLAESDDWRSIPHEHRGAGLVFVPVEETKAIKNRLHLDLAPRADDDQDAEVRRLLDLGARRVDVGQTEEATWVVLADPEGNEFCVLSPRDH